MIAAPPDATNENAGRQPGVIDTNQTHDRAHRSTSRDEEKAFSTLRARFAMAGHTLHRTVNADGSIGYVASRWTYSRELPDADAAQRFLSQIGGA